MIGRVWGLKFRVCPRMLKRGGPKAGIPFRGPPHNKIIVFWCLFWVLSMNFGV